METKLTINQLGTVPAKPLQKAYLLVAGGLSVSFLHDLHVLHGQNPPRKSLLLLALAFARPADFPMGRRRPQGAVTRLCVKNKLVAE